MRGPVSYTGMERRMERGMERGAGGGSVGGAHSSKWPDACSQRAYHSFLLSPQPLTAGTVALESTNHRRMCETGAHDASLLGKEVGPRCLETCPGDPGPPGEPGSAWELGEPGSAASAAPSGTSSCRWCHCAPSGASRISPCSAAAAACSSAAAAQGRRMKNWMIRGMWLEMRLPTS